MQKKRDEALVRWRNPERMCVGEKGKDKTRRMRGEAKETKMEPIVLKGSTHGLCFAVCFLGLHRAS